MIKGNEKPIISIEPEILRRSDGGVERRRITLVVDILPNGDDYELQVTSTTIPAAMIRVADTTKLYTK